MPDVSGIDKIFDYLVPDSLAGKAAIGARVRVVLNNRRVSGWIVRLEHRDSTTSEGLPLDRLSDILAVSGLGVESEVVPLTKWVADECYGSWRSMLSRASAPRVRERHVHSRRTVAHDTDEPVADVTASLADNGGGLLVIGPAASALAVVNSLVRRGPVLAVCPTLRMAILGAAALRRRGLSVAVVPDDWDAARAGVDVVIGARSAVFAPCRELSSIVVIDEHDELHHDERSPTWNSVDAAGERARLTGVPCVLTSAVPSAESMVRHAGATVRVAASVDWPRVVVEDLNQVPVAQSLLTTSLLDAVSDSHGTTVCVLNTKGKARLVVCKTCRALQTCDVCGSALTREDSGQLQCTKCPADRGLVCVSCGRTSLVVPRGGTAHLLAQVQKSTGRPVVEVTADTADDWISGSVFVGTEAVLFRVPQAETVVFADIDRDLNAPRVTASREVAALLVRAARLVGAAGRVVVQTRTPQHPLLRAFASDDISAALFEWNLTDLSSRKTFGFPPFGVLARVSLAEGAALDNMPDLSPVRCAVRPDDALLSAGSRSEMRDAVERLRLAFGTALRVHADPTRY